MYLIERGGKQNPQKQLKAEKTKSPENIKNRK